MSVNETPIQGARNKDNQATLSKGKISARNKDNRSLIAGRSANVYIDSAL